MKRQVHLCFRLQNLREMLLLHNSAASTVTEKIAPAARMQKMGATSVKLMEGSGLPAVFCFLSECSLFQKLRSPALCIICNLQHSERIHTDSFHRTLCLFVCLFVCL